MFPRMAEISRNLDVALLPVWGWGPTLGSGHMTPARAAKSLGLLRPEVAIPIHWGTFHPLGMGWLSPRFLWVPPRLFAREAAEFAPDVRIEILQPGDETEL